MRGSTDKLKQYSTAINSLLEEYELSNKSSKEALQELCSFAKSCDDFSSLWKEMPIRFYKKVIKISRRAFQDTYYEDITFVNANQILMDHYHFFMSYGIPLLKNGKKQDRDTLNSLFKACLKKCQEESEGQVDPLKHYPDILHASLALAVQENISHRVLQEVIEYGPENYDEYFRLFFENYINSLGNNIATCSLNQAKNYCKDIKSLTTAISKFPELQLDHQIKVLNQLKRLLEIYQLIIQDEVTQTEIKELTYIFDYSDDNQPLILWAQDIYDLHLKKICNKYAEGHIEELSQHESADSAMSILIQRFNKNNPEVQALSNIIYTISDSLEKVLKQQRVANVAQTQDGDEALTSQTGRKRTRVTLEDVEIPPSQKRQRSHEAEDVAKNALSVQGAEQGNEYSEPQASVASNSAIAATSVGMFQSPSHSDTQRPEAAQTFATDGLPASSSDVVVPLNETLRL